MSKTVDSAAAVSGAYFQKDLLILSENEKREETPMLFSFFTRKLRYLSSSGAFQQSEPDNDGETQAKGQSDIKKSLEENLDALGKILNNGSDLITHRFRFGPGRSITGALMFFDGLISNEIITQAILRPVTEWCPDEKKSTNDSLIETLYMDVLCSGDVKIVKTLPELSAGCLSGDAVLLVDGGATGLVVSAKGWDKRSVTEPKSETVVRGPREGFTENLRTNTALIRRKIKNGQLCTKLLIVGEKTQTSICLMYLTGVADSQVVDEVERRISGLDVDSILESGYIEQYIEDAPFSTFGTIGYSEKPDVVAARVLEGRVAIVVDGTPFVLTAPMLFIESFQTAEDYYTRPIYASLMRMLRFFAYLISVFAPAIYIALTTFHQEMIPTTLLFTIANAREGTPFPVFLEALVMVITFEILREGGVRLPRPVGQAVSIVGALVMGDAAVSAGLVGAPVVITIAITAVAGFLVPAQSDAVSIQRLVMMALAAFSGFFGVAMGVLAFLIHLSTLTSFGVPYFDGFAWTRNLQDSVIRMPLWTMVMRPKDIAKSDTTRRRFFVPPLRPYASQSSDESAGEK